MVINDRKRLTAMLEDPAIIITTDNLDLQSQLIDVVQAALKAGKKRMVFFANSIGGTALAFLVANHMQDKISCIPIQIPSFGDYQRDMIYDLAKKTGATVLGEDCPLKLKDADASCFGKAESVISTRDYTVVVGANEDVSERVDETKALLE